MSAIHVEGVFAFELCDESGAVVDRWESRNFITTLGLYHVADQLSDQDEAAMSHMAVGSGTGRTIADQTLVTELARVALTVGYPDQDVAPNQDRVLYAAVFGAGVGTGTISEVAVFNAAVAGVMFNYSDAFTPRVKDAGQTLNLTLRSRIFTAA